MAFAGFLAVLALIIWLSWRWRGKPQIAILALLAWAFLPIYDTIFRRSCPGDCSIRVDMLIVVPVLAILTLGGLWSAYKWLRR